jgi:outer membrane protein assembly factor BamA
VKDARSRTGPLTADDVRAYLRQRPGRPFKRAWLDRDVLAIYDSGYFHGVGADATCANGEVTIRLRVMELPVVASVKVLMPDGTSVVDDPSKGGPIQTYPGSAFSYAVVAHDRKALADALERRGKPSEVTCRTRWFEPNDVEVTFEVSPASAMGRSP